MSWDRYCDSQEESEYGAFLENLIEDLFHLEEDIHFRELSIPLRQEIERYYEANGGVLGFAGNRQHCTDHLNLHFPGIVLPDDLPYDYLTKFHRAQHGERE